MWAKLILRKSKYDSTADALSQLHCLPIKHRINFKIATITPLWNCPIVPKGFAYSSPKPRSLRSSNTKSKLIIPFAKCKTFTTQSFSIVESSVWIQLLMLLQETANFELFKRQLKSHFYWVAFYWVLHENNSLHHCSLTIANASYH